MHHSAEQPLVSSAQAGGGGGALLDQFRGVRRLVADVRGAVPLPGVELEAVLAGPAGDGIGAGRCLDEVSRCVWAVESGGKVHLLGESLQAPVHVAAHALGGINAGVEEIAAGRRGLHCGSRQGVKCRGGPPGGDHIGAGGEVIGARHRREEYCCPGVSRRALSPFPRERLALTLLVGRRPRLRSGMLPDQIADRVAEDVQTPGQVSKRIGGHPQRVRVARGRSDWFLGQELSGGISTTGVRLPGVLKVTGRYTYWLLGTGLWACG